MIKKRYYLIFAVVLFVVPIIVDKVYVRYCSLCSKDILAYFASVFGAFSTVAGAIITVTAAFKQQEKERKSREEARRKEICPNLRCSVSLLNREKKNYLLTVTNEGKSPAMDVHFESTPLCSVIKPNSKCTKEIHFECNEEKDGLYIYVDESKLKNDASFPADFSLYYHDVEWNTLEQDFLWEDEETINIWHETCYL